MNTFAELEINIFSVAEHRYRVHLRYRPPGSQADVRLGQGLEGEAAPLVEIDNLGDEALDREAYARNLTNAIFNHPQLALQFSEALANASATGAPLRLRLWIDSGAAHLHNLRWELLLNPKDGTCLGLGEKILFSRGLSSANAAPVTLRPPEEARALLAVAAPNDLEGHKLAKIEPEQELARVRPYFDGLRACASLPDPAGSRATLDNLFAALSAGVDVLYLVCHGTIANDEAYLWLEDAAGRTQRVSATEFVGCLRGLAALPVLVVLASCQSGGGQGGPAWLALGPRLVDAGVAAVLAMQGNFSMRSEALFMPHFFAALREHGEVDRAVSFARNFIAGHADWWMPVLFSRLRDNRLFERSDPHAAATLPRQPFEPETIFIPAGSFPMGTDDPARPIYEHPQHPVALKSYRIGKFPVTNREYAEFIRQTKGNVPPEVWGGAQTLPKGQDKMPVQGVTWYNAFDYCKWLSEKTGRSYRLPTEAEWEKAARGEDGRTYPWGNAWDPARCASDANHPQPVDALSAQSVYGCFDMVGNIREWTLSLWGQNRLEPESAYLYPYVEDDGRNDPTASKLVRRVIRGAGLNDAPESLTCFARNAYIPDKPGPPGKRHGFRVVMEI